MRSYIPILKNARKTFESNYDKDNKKYRGDGEKNIAAICSFAYGMSMYKAYEYVKGTDLVYAADASAEELVDEIENEGPELHIYSKDKKKFFDCVVNFMDEDEGFKVYRVPNQTLVEVVLHELGDEEIWNYDHEELHHNGDFIRNAVDTVVTKYLGDEKINFVMNKTLAAKIMVEILDHLIEEDNLIKDPEELGVADNEVARIIKDTIELASFEFYPMAGQYFGN